MNATEIFNLIGIVFLVLTNIAIIYLRYVLEKRGEMLVNAYEYKFHRIYWDLLVGKFVHQSEEVNRVIAIARLFYILFWIYLALFIGRVVWLLVLE